MKTKTIEKELKLELKFATDKFMHEYFPEHNYFDEGKKEWIETSPKREVVTQIEGEMKFTHRNILLNKLGKSQEWHRVNINHNNYLNSDGSLNKKLNRKAYLGISIDLCGIPDNKKYIEPEIEEILKKNLPDYNFGIKININSAFESIEQEGDYIDTRDIYRPVVREFVNYMIKEAKKEINLNNEIMEKK